MDEDGGEAEAAVGGVDDEAGDGADVKVDEVLAFFGRELGEVEGAVAGLAIQDVVKAFKGFIVGAGAGFEDEAAGDEV